MCGAPRVGVFIDMVRELNQKHSLSITPSSTFGQWAWDNKQHWWLPSSFAQVVYGIMKAEKNITLMCGSPVVDAVVETKGNRNRVTGVCVMRQGMLQKVSAPVTIDATGTGLLAAKPVVKNSTAVTPSRTSTKVSDLKRATVECSHVP